MKKGLERYLNKKETIKKRDEFNRNNYVCFSFKLNKIKDKDMIDYFNNADNKSRALRELFRK